MDRTWLLIIEFWVLTGAFIGGVVTPVVSSNRRVNDWLMALVGVVVGAVGNLVLLVPLWLLLSRQDQQTVEGPAWQRDAMSVDDARVAAEEGIDLDLDLDTLRDGAAVLTRNFWPANEGHGHSHRMTYIGVFVALAVVTLVEVLLSYMDSSGDPPFPVVGPLVALSTVKVLLVVLYFMHLRFDSKWYAAIFVFSVPFAAMVLAVLAVA